MRRIHVVAALTERDGRLLAHQRPAHQVRGGLWELPGGKVEAGETEPEALVRECQEELGAAVQVGALVWRGEHAYADLTVALAVYRVTLAASQALVAHEGGTLAWVSPQEVAGLAWSAADHSIIEAWAAKRL